MFTVLFLLLTLAEFSAWCGAFYFLYRVIFSSSIKERKRFKQEKVTAEKMATVILQSSSSKEIVNFITNNVNLLSDSTLNKLNQHLEFINILSEEPLKARFESLEDNAKTQDDSGIEVKEIILNEPIRDVIDILNNPPKLKN